MPTQACIGIRREDKNAWERRAPLTPAHVEQLVADGLSVCVQPSKLRVYDDAAYDQAGARVTEDLSQCSAVFGVKEMPIDFFQPASVYAFFSHTIKGQAYNMPLLRALLNRRATLIDYERVVDAEGRRLVFFGRFAGIAGMIDGLWALGKRLENEGLETPFADLMPAHRYSDMASAKKAVESVGERIKSEGLPTQIQPLTLGVTGYGNVAKGALEIADLLPVEHVAPQNLGSLAPSPHKVFVAVFEEKDMFTPKADTAFDLHHYFAHPDAYEARFAHYLPHLTLLANCIYWDAKGPRLVTHNDLKALYAQKSQPNLRVIADVSCDVDGSMQCTTKSTSSDNPVYVYEPHTQRSIDGVAGQGPVVLAVDNLPCELPKESSTFFGDCLAPFVKSIAAADASAPFPDLELPPEVKGAVITHQGELTPNYTYLAQFIEAP